MFKSFLVLFLSLASLNTFAQGPSYDSCQMTGMTNGRRISIAVLECQPGNERVYITEKDVEKITGKKVDDLNEFYKTNASNITSYIKSGKLRVFRSAGDDISSMNRNYGDEDVDYNSQIKTAGVTLKTYSAGELKSGLLFKERCRFVMKESYKVTLPCGEKNICEALINCAYTPTDNDMTLSGLMSISCDATNCSDIQACAADQSVKKTKSGGEITPVEYLNVKEAGRAQ